MKKLRFLVIGGIGYVLGTRAGRERYEQIKGVAQKVKNNPTVQQKTHQAADAAREQAPAVKDRLTEAAGVAASKVRPSGGSHLEDELHPNSTARQDEPYPKGDLP